MTNEKLSITDFENAFSKNKTKAITTHSHQDNITPSVESEYTKVLSEIETGNCKESYKVEDENNTFEQNNIDNLPENKPVLINPNESIPKHKASSTDLKNQSNWIKGRCAITSSTKTLIPGVFVAALAITITQMINPDDLVSIVFEPSIMAKQPEFLQDNIATILKVGIYFIAGLSLYLSVKAKSQGKLFIYDSYLLHKKSMFKKHKILLPQIVSIDIHWTPFSLLQNVGNIEISSIKGEILFKNCPNPDQVKDLIEEKCRSFKEV